MAVETRDRFNMAVVTALVAGITAAMVSIYSFVDTSQDRTNESQVRFERLAVMNEELRTDLLSLNEKLSRLQQSVAKNEALVRSLESNLSLQTDLLKEVVRPEVRP